MVEKTPNCKNDTSELWNTYWKGKNAITWEGRSISRAQAVTKTGLKYLDEIFSLVEGKRFLECGCGSATVSRYLALKGYDVTMLGSSGEAINRAKERFATCGLKGRFVAGDLNSLGFADGAFDIVFSGGVIHHFEGISGPISEMVRVLRPGGLFVATIITKRFSLETVAHLWNFSMRFTKRLVVLRPAGIIKDSRRNFPFYENSYSKDYYKKAMEDAGLEKVIITGINPFPDLLLPGFLETAYARFIDLMKPAHLRFNRSSLTITDTLGTGWAAYGIKKG